MINIHPIQQLILDLEFIGIKESNNYFEIIAIQLCVRKNLRERIGDGAVTFDALEKLVETIYAGMISGDPYEPQEIKLALTDDPAAMKAISS